MLLREIQAEFHIGDTCAGLRLSAATAVAIFLFVTDLISLGAGPIVVGVIGAEPLPKKWARHVWLP